MIQQDLNTVPSPKSLALAVTGLDACKFLQGQLTCDVAALADGQSTLGAYCNIKGKVESLFTLSRAGDSYHMRMTESLLQPTLNELKKYAVFSKVKLEAIEQPYAEVNEHAEILAKIPALYPQTVGMFFPHDLNLPGLGAVSFTKGCYRGQEIVARMEHRGNLKRSLVLFSTIDTEVLPGAAINTSENILAGRIVRHLKYEGQLLGLAVLNEQSPAQQIFLNAFTVSVYL